MGPFSLWPRGGRLEAGCLTTEALVSQDEAPPPGREVSMRAGRGRGGIKCVSCLGQRPGTEPVLFCDVRPAVLPTFPCGRLHFLLVGAPQALLLSLST